MFKALNKRLVLKLKYINFRNQVELPFYFSKVAFLVLRSFIFM